MRKQLNMKTESVKHKLSALPSIFLKCLEFKQNVPLLMCVYNWIWKQKA